MQGGWTNVQGAEMAVRAGNGAADGGAGSMKRPDRQPPPCLVEDLHVCPECGSGLVHPVDWTAADAVHWRVELRCPECEHRSVGLYEQSVVDRFDQILDAGADSLYADLRRLERTNMEAELKRFSTLLAADLVLPEDF